MKPIASILLLTLLVLSAPLVSAEDYNIAELRDENSNNPPPFSIARVEEYSGGLRLLLTTGIPDGIAALLTSGAFEAQLSDHSNETTSPVTLSLGKAVWCTEDSAPVYLGYGEVLPACGGQLPVRVEYFLNAAVTLGPDRDLAIGQDPEFLWLVEER
jgi:hypothetical protein